MSDTRAPILEVKGLKKHFRLGGGFLSPVKIVRAVEDVSFALKKGETLAVVGESGCGKSTLAKVLMRLEEKTEGRIFLHGKETSTFSSREFVKYMQMVFQDPYSSLNPRKKVRQIVAEPLVINTELSAKEIDERVQAVLAKVGLPPEASERYPHMFSGGQRQRIGIARALTLQPEILICDEPVSALDVSIQAQVLNLLMDLQDELGLSYIFISHDLSVVRHIANEVMVMYLGQVMEKGPRDSIFGRPLHPYTQTLLAATPDLTGFLKNGSATPQDRANQALSKSSAEMPSPLEAGQGCAFAKRCAQAHARCLKEVPSLRPHEGVLIACHLFDERSR